jgi:hypothetical protein
MLPSVLDATFVNASRGWAPFSGVCTSAEPSLSLRGLVGMGRPDLTLPAVLRVAKSFILDPGVSFPLLHLWRVAGSDLTRYGCPIAHGWRKVQGLSWEPVVAMGPMGTQAGVSEMAFPTRRRETHRRGRVPLLPRLDAVR